MKPNKTQEKIIFAFAVNGFGKGSCLQWHHFPKGIADAKLSKAITDGILVGDGPIGYKLTDKGKQLYDDYFKIA